MKRQLRVKTGIVVPKRIRVEDAVSAASVPLDSLPSYRLQYHENGPRLFLVLCQKHLAKRLTAGASVLEKRSSYPVNEPCSDCNHERGKLR